MVFSPDFEGLTSMQLADILRHFHGEVDTCKSWQYSRSALTGIRAGISRHIQNLPFNKITNIVVDKEFSSANKV